MTRVRRTPISHLGKSIGSDAPTRIAAEMEACVYAVSTPDGLIKIGYTTNLDRRIRGFGSVWADVLVVIDGDLAYEKALHSRFVPYLARGAEYYYPVREIRDWINSERSLFGIQATA